MLGCSARPTGLAVACCTLPGQLYPRSRSRRQDQRHALASVPPVVLARKLPLRNIITCKSVLLAWTH
jgi:hypothetical protein